MNKEKEEVNMLTRGFTRGLAVFGEIVMTLILILLPILAGAGLAVKIGFGLLWVLFTLLMINPISGKLWDAVHPKANNGVENRINKEQKN